MKKSTRPVRVTGSQFGRGNPPVRVEAQLTNVFRVDPPTKASKPIHELNRSECHWPLWHRFTIDAPFCGEPTLGDHPYCLKHVRRSYVRFR